MNPAPPVTNTRTARDASYVGSGPLGDNPILAGPIVTTSTHGRRYLHLGARARLRFVFWYRVHILDGHLSGVFLGTVR
jgi:hypothetical protein